MAILSCLHVINFGGFFLPHAANRKVFYLPWAGAAQFQLQKIIQVNFCEIKISSVINNPNIEIHLTEFHSLFSVFHSLFALSLSHQLSSLR